MNDKEKWQQDGFIIKRNLIPEEYMLTYEKLWIEHHGKIVDDKLEMINPTGWSTYNIFKDHEEIKKIFCATEIPVIIEELIGRPAGLHLNFTGWISTQKTWHQDVTVADKKYADNYIGVWIALEDIHPDSGPFELIPGSHNWDIDFEAIYPSFQRPDNEDFNTVDVYGTEAVENNKIEDDPSATAYRFYTKKLLEEQPPGITFLGQRGDVIFWHGHAVHRGSEPNNINLTRKCIIGHLSALDEGMLAHQKTEKYSNGYYFNC